MPLDSVSISQIMQDNADFSGVVYVRQHGQTVFGAGYGYANRADELHNTLNTRFGIASGTKLLTAVAICQLVEQGKLTFETRLQEVLSIPFPQFDPTITVHHLLTHTSGVPDYFDEDVMDDYGVLWLERPTYTMRSPRDFLSMFQNHPMKFKAGERFYYNNSGFVLLGLIIEAVSGQSYIEYVTAHVLQASGMTDSGFFALNQLPSRTAFGYLPMEDGQWRTNIFEIPIIGGADGGVFVTAPDFGRFWDALFNHRLLSPAMTERLLSPHATYQRQSGDIRGYGYGIWLVLDEETVLRYYAEGADPGASFVSAVVPKHNIEMTVISNVQDGAWDVWKALIASI